MSKPRVGSYADFLGWLQRWDVKSLSRLNSTASSAILVSFAKSFTHDLHSTIVHDYKLMIFMTLARISWKPNLIGQLKTMNCKLC